MFDKEKMTTTGIVAGITFIFMVLMNVLANLLPLNGQTTGEVSDSYSNLFAPAGYTFAIWGLIYLMLALYTMYQLGFFREDERQERKSFFNKIGILFAISSLANALWIFMWHYELIFLSTILIAIVLICLIIINENIKKQEFSLKEKIFVRAPFSIYFGWVTVATIANITVLFVSLGWTMSRGAEGMWTIIILLVGLAIGMATMMKNKDILYGLVLVWSYIGIYIKHISEAGWNNEFPLVIATVTISVVLLFAAMGYMIFSEKKSIARSKR